MINKSMVCIFCHTFRQYRFHILTDVIFVLSDIYQLKSAMHKNAFSYSKTGPAPLWRGSESYSSAFYLVTLSEEIDCGRKYWEKKNTEPPKNYNVRSRKMRVCSPLPKFWNKIIQIYLSNQAVENLVSRLH